MKKNIERNLDVVFVIDKSGSMSGSEENTISSFNEYIEREYNNSYNTNVTTILFSDNYKYLYRKVQSNLIEVFPEALVSLALRRPKNFYSLILAGVKSR